MDLASQVSDINGVTHFNICRTRVWDGARRAFQRKMYSPNAVMSVKFTDDVGKSEGAVDLGGPRRELLTLLMDYLANGSPVFVGNLHDKYLTQFSTGERSCLAILKNIHQ